MDIATIKAELTAKIPVQGAFKWANAHPDLHAVVSAWGDYTDGYGGYPGNHDGCAYESVFAVTVEYRPWHESREITFRGVFWTKCVMEGLDNSRMLDCMVFYAISNMQEVISEGGC
jgi:hypothetical protein